MVVRKFDCSSNILSISCFDSVHCMVAAGACLESISRGTAWTPKSTPPRRLGYEWMMFICIFWKATAYSCTSNPRFLITSSQLERRLEKFPFQGLVQRRPLLLRGPGDISGVLFFSSVKVRNFHVETYCFYWPLGKDDVSDAAYYRSRNDNNG